MCVCASLWSLSTQVRTKRQGASIRHPATDEIFNPRFGLQESGKSASGKSTSALDYLDKRFEAKSHRDSDNDGGLARRAPRVTAEPEIGEASF